MSAISDLRQDVTKGLSNARGWLEELETKIPQALDEADKLNGDPLVRGIVESGLHVPDAWVEFALDFLGKLATVATAAAGVTQPATAAVVPADTSATPIADSVTADLAAPAPDAQPAA